MKSCASSSAIVASTCGSSLWLSTVARPWPGMCLITGSRPPARMPSSWAPPSVATASTRIAERAVADRRRAPLDRHVEHRQAIDADPERVKVERDELRPEKRRLDSGERVLLDRSAP